MIRLLLFVGVLCEVYGDLVPLIYAAPSAVSHQSRIDIKHSPGFVAGPLIYSPAATVYANQQLENKVREAVITPVFTADTILTPVALSFFHNLPLARALEHPISIDKAQEDNAENYEFVNAVAIPEQENLNQGDKQPASDKIIIVAYDDSSKVVSTTNDPPIEDVTEKAVLN
uniref:SFRICE_014036 n=1 Tax=Spodoptera frugiperda TaxID=7108 RepID=A0A2H1V1N3_SPOFR